jgi:hypothetical protein
MIRTWVMFCGLQSQSMLMLLPFAGARHGLLVAGARLARAAPLAPVSPTRSAYLFLSGKSSLMAISPHDLSATLNADWLLDND